MCVNFRQFSVVLELKNQKIFRRLELHFCIGQKLCPFLFFRTLPYDSRLFPAFPANSCSIAYYHLRKNWLTGLGMWVKYYSSFAIQNGAQTNLFACCLGLKIVKFIEIQHLPTCYLDHIRIGTKPLAAPRPLLCWKCNEMFATLSILAD